MILGPGTGGCFETAQDSLWPERDDSLFTPPPAGRVTGRSGYPVSGRTPVTTSRYATNYIMYETVLAGKCGKEPKMSGTRLWYVLNGGDADVEQQSHGRVTITGKKETEVAIEFSLCRGGTG